MDIAIIGMAGRFPEASNTNEFYQNLRAGRDSVRQLSRTRLREMGASPTDEYRVAGFLDQIDQFDYAFFDLSKAEAECMDPRQRLLLETAYAAIENAGYDVDAFRGSETATFIGDVHLDYDQQADRFDPMLMTGNRNSIAAGRIARFFDLRGKALMVDTTCSSALVALHLAANELRLGEAEFALVGGINIDLVPVPANNPYELGINALEGKAKPFSADADGTGNGEMVGCLLLRPLTDALRDQNVIHAVLKGSAVNQDAARAASLTAPSSTAQADVIQKAWQRAGVDPRTIGYIEAHGTGTKLGDPIEVQGMNLAFALHTADRHFCAISSVKSNVGHTDTAAGLTGVMKAVLSLKNRELFPNVHFGQPNPLIDFVNSAVYVNDRLRPWVVADGQPRRAGVSSFGLMGSNAHVVLEESPILTPTNASEAASYLITVSGKTPRSLARNVARLRQFVATNPTVSLPDLQFTLNAGRKQYSHRWAVVVSQLRELQTALSNAAIAAPTSRKKADVVLLFSPDGAFDSQTRQVLADRYPAFRDACNECLLLAKNRRNSSALQTFISQYASFNLLEKLKLTGASLVGFGVGQITIEVVTGRLSLANAIAQVLELSPTDLTPLEDKCRKLLVKRTADAATGTTNTVFAEVGAEGSIGKWLIELQDTPNRLPVLRNDPKQTDPFLPFLADLYVNRAPFQFRPAELGWAGQRIELPTYAFDTHRCWLKEPVATDWQSSLFHTLKWVVDPIVAKPPLTGRTLLVVGNADNSLVETVLNQLTETGNRCIRVTLGSTCQPLQTNTATLRPDQPDDYKKLHQQLHQQGITLDGIVYLGASEPTKIGESLSDQTARALYVPLLLAKAFSDQLSRRGFGFACLTAHAGCVSTTDTVLTPAHVLTNALLKALLSDHPTLIITSVDSDPNTSSPTETARQLLAEMARPDGVRFVAYRAGVRYLPRLTTLPPQPFPVPPSPAFREGGVYLVTGGANGLGNLAARWLAQQGNCHLVIVGKTPLPSPLDWPVAAQTDTPEGHRCRALLDLELAGATVTYFAADVSEKAEVTNLFKAIQTRYGHLEGIIHAAGVGLKRLSLNELSLSEIAHTLAPKVAGSVWLAEASRPFALDFFVFYSSLNALVPLKNSVDYAVANAFEDAFAQALRLNNCPAIAINWPGWAGANDSNAAVADLPLLSPERGIESLAQAIAANRPNVAIVNYALNQFTSNPFFLVEQVTAEHEPVAPISEAINEPTLALTVAATTPNLSTEAQVMAIWMEVLRADHIELDDDFFEIGGHSLNGSQVLNRVAQAFGLDIEFDLLFDYATVRTLAEYIDEHRPKTVESTPPTQGIERVADQPHYPLSYAQQRMWILNHFQPNQTAYCIQGAYLLSGPLEVEAFGWAIEELLNRHESLRTSFVTINDEPRQLIDNNPSAARVFTYLYRPQLTGVQLSELITRNTRPFDLMHGPLIRLTLVRQSDTEHVLLLAMHHSIADGWSLGVIFHDLMNRYRACLGEAVPPLADLPIQYRDFSVWQRDYLGTDRAQPARQFWHAQLQQPLPVIDLPFSRPRPELKTHNGHTIRGEISPELTNGLKRLQQQTGTTLFMVLVAGLKALLYRYTGQPDLIVGVPVAGRNQPELESQVGLFVNTLALRTQVADNDTFETLLEQVKTNWLHAFQYQDYPFDQLVEELGIVKDPARSPVFDVMVALHNHTGLQVADTEAPFTISELPVAPGGSKFDLTLNLSETDDRLQIFLEYNTDLLTEASARRIMEQFERLLTNALAHTDQTLRTLSYLTNEEAEALISFNDTTRPFPDQVSLIDLFNAQTKRNPNRVVVTAPEGNWTYWQIEEHATTLAHSLLTKYDLQPGDRVGVLCQRSGWMLSALLGIQKAGGAYLPLDPNYPQEHLQFVLDDAGVITVILDIDQLVDPQFSWLREHYRLIDIQQLPITNDGGGLVANLPKRVSPDQLAYVIYTSGSTGRPKGVLVNHRAVVNRIHWMWNHYQFTERDVILQKTPNVFDVSVWEIFMPLCFGARLVVCPREVSIDPLRLMSLVATQGITTMHFVPGMLAVFQEACTPANRNLMASVRHLMASGEALHPEHVRRHYQLFNIPLHNLYGPTEATVDVSFHETRPTDEIVPIGRPIANIDLLVLDWHRLPLPVGMPGEIGISGIGLAQGYLNRPKLTAERFVPHPSRPNERVYLTGDLGMWQANGTLAYLGRNDNQVKIRGNRVELGEIENTLLRHEGVEQAVVITTGDGSGEKSLCGYYVSASKVSPDGLRRFLADRLPGFMQPAWLIPVHEFQFTANGKIDRKALPTIESVLADRPATAFAPGSPLEADLAETVAEVLNQDTVGIQDNFFTIGLDSLKLIRVFNRLQARYPELTEVTDLFKAHSVQLLARHIEAGRTTALQPASLQL